MSDPDDCGCCAGLAAGTPQARLNRPGLPAIAYRVGTHASFKASLLARLSSNDFPALAGLTTRENGDWSIALLDACATLGDVLTFYQERIANESYLRTATQRASTLELARLVGYRPAPGVAASASLAFTLDLPLVQPAPTPQPVVVPVGTRVQNVPDEGQAPQTFETTAEIVARAQWNALPVQASRRELPHAGQRVLWLQGTATQLRPGDALLFVGAARENDGGSEAWNLRWLDAVTVDDARGLTRVQWPDGLDQFSPRGVPNEDGVRVFALRQRAALFGHNAPDPNLVIPAQMPDAQKKQLVEDAGEGALRWKNYAVLGGQVDLDAVYPRIVADSWFVLSVDDKAELHRVGKVQELSRSDFAVSGKVTRVTPAAGEAIGFTGLRATSFHGQSEELTLAERPLPQPLFGDELPLASVQPLLVPGQRLALRGRRQRVAVPENPAGVRFMGDAARVALPGESFIVAAAPAWQRGEALPPAKPEQLDPESGADGLLHWTLLDRDGQEIEVEAQAGVLRLQPARESDPVVEELADIAEGADAVTHDRDRSTLRLAAALGYCYDRATLRVNANVAPATQGETVNETAGSGDASQPGQRLRLRQAPLTHVAAANAQGRDPTLEVRVNGLRWEEVRTLFEQPPDARVYARREDDEGRSTVQFGDGVEGARLPTGTDNVRLRYRKGVGEGGNLRAGTLTTLVSRPLGVNGVTNPAPAAGGEDPESRDDMRRNAPLTVLTLDRVVSVLDYADFARAFAGIAKATALWIEEGPARGVHLTVAGSRGDPVAAGSDTQLALFKALRSHGDALLPLTLQTYAPASFELQARVQADPARVGAEVLAAVDKALREAFAFAARDFGQPVTYDEVLAVAHRVAGVQAVDIERLHRTGVDPGKRPEARLFPMPAQVDADRGRVTAAELLTLGGLKLELML